MATLIQEDSCRAEKKNQKHQKESKIYSGKEYCDK